MLNVKEVIGESQGEYATQAQRVIEDLRTAQININNSKRWHREVVSNIKVMEGSVESDTYRLEGVLSKIRQPLSSKENYAKWKSDGYVPFELFDDVMEMHDFLKGILQWKVLQFELMEIAVDKVFTALNDLEDYTVKEKAIERAEKMEQLRNETFLSSVKHETKMFTDAIQSIQKQANTDRVEIIHMMTNNMTELAYTLLELSKEMPEKSQLSVNKFAKNVRDSEMDIRNKHVYNQRFFEKEESNQGEVPPTQNQEVNNVAEKDPKPVSQIKGVKVVDNIDKAPSPPVKPKTADEDIVSLYDELHSEPGEKKKEKTNWRT